MSERIFTLFGEEIVPEQLKAVGKSRAKKKPEEKKAEEEQLAEKPKPKKAIAAVPEVATTPEVVAAPEAVTISEVTQETEEAEPAAEEKNFELPEDWKGDKKYYSIGEVAALFKVKTSHIRFWTNEFKLKVRTTRKGDRLYTPEQVRELRTIHHLVKERGFKLSGAKAKLKAQNNKDVEVMDLKTSLLQLRNKLVIIKNQLTTPTPKGE